MIQNHPQEMLVFTQRPLRLLPQPLSVEVGGQVAGVNVRCLELGQEINRLTENGLTQRHFAVEFGRLATRRRM